MRYYADIRVNGAWKLTDSAFTGGDAAMCIVIREAQRIGLMPVWP